MSKECGFYLDKLVAENGEPQTWEDACRIVQTATVQLGADRHRNYGAGNIKKFGAHGVIIRANDKLERLITMIWGNRESVEETVEDSFGDLSNYAVYGIMLGRGWWDLPLSDDHSPPQA